MDFEEKIWKIPEADSKNGKAWSLEQADAWRTVGERLDWLISYDSSNVVPLKKAG